MRRAYRSRRPTIDSVRCFAEVVDTYDSTLSTLEPLA